MKERHSRHGSKAAAYLVEVPCHRNIALSRSRPVGCIVNKIT